MKISLIQMNSQPDRQHNLKEAARLMREAVALDAPDLIVLPEHFDWSGGTAEQKALAADRVPNGQAYRMLQEFAASNRVWVHGGSLLERIDGSDRIHNTTLVFDPSGSEMGRYRKIHLFDVTAPDGKVYRESDTVAPGNELVVYQAHGFRIGCAICYDLRFSSLFDALSKSDVDVVILPAAFTAQTGKDHWEVLCRARAIELQAYFVACGQWGRYPTANGEQRYSYGHSLVCDPWGHVIARASDDIGVATTRIDKRRLEAVRKLIPMAGHRIDFSAVSTRVDR